MIRTASILPFFLVVLLLGACGEQNADGPADGAAPLPERTAAVAMPDAQSATVAADILAAGGNAVDAAVAAGFALAVTEPEAGNIGGGGFMLIHIDGEAHFIDYRETAPMAADRDMYHDVDGNVVKGMSRVGHLAVGVPGSVAGLYAAHAKFGKLPWRDVVMPSVNLARDGFVVHEYLARSLARGIDKFADSTNFGDYFSAVPAGGK
ncbi:MAG: gamma-glutamyltransferase, partial [Pseudomonadota bacterium]